MNIIKQWIKQKESNILSFVMFKAISLHQMTNFFKVEFLKKFAIWCDYCILVFPDVRDTSEV